jgi:hypothetical protein
MWRRGFLGESHLLYQFDRHNPADYVSDAFRWFVTPSIDRSPYLMDDKYVFGMVLLGLGAPTPTLLGTYSGDARLVTPGHSYAAADPAFIEFLERSGVVVFKPRAGGGGAKILFVATSAGSLTINSSPASATDLFDYMGRSDYIACSFVRQHPYAADIFPRSTNTLRVLTMVGPETGRPFVAAAVHRFGVTGSVPVDNFSQGGLSVDVDPATGVLGSGVTFPKDGVLRFHEAHPETGKPIKGVLIPGWSAISTGLLGLAAQLPSDIPYVGWDVVVTQDGYSVLEGNRYSDVNLLQVHRPLLPDPRVRAFYRFHAVRLGRGRAIRHWPANA